MADRAKIERVARAIYAQNPIEDQDADLDGRAIGKPYAIPWEKLIEYDNGWHDLVWDQALAAIDAIEHETHG